MSWSLLEQCLDVVLTSLFVVRLVQLRLQRKYLALLTFVIFDGLQALLYIPLRVYQPFDYRLYFLATSLLEWCTTIWLVYALLALILEQLPGIRRFSVKFLNVVFAGWVVISTIIMRLEWSAYMTKANRGLLKGLVIMFRMLDGTFSLAQILIMISVLLFVLRYPIHVPRNLSAFSAAISIFLCARIILLLSLFYMPDFHPSPILLLIPNVVISISLLLWIFVVNAEGEETQVILGRAWDAIPKEHLVHQLEALNAALLSSRERA